MVLILLPLSNALEINCNDDGSIAVLGSTRSGEVSAKEKGTRDPYIDVPGRWQSYEEGEDECREMKWGIDEKPPEECIEDSEFIGDDECRELMEENFNASVSELGV